MEKIDREFLFVFVDEAKTLLLEWDRSLSAFRQTGFEEHIDVLFRLTHNLKGTSRSIGLTSFSNFVHEVENALKYFKEQNHIHHRTLAPLLQECQNFLESWLDQLTDESDHCPDTSALVKKLHEFSKRQKKGAFPNLSMGRRAKRKTSNGTTKNTEAEENHTIRVSDAKLEDLAHLLRSLTRNQIRVLDLIKQKRIRNPQAKRAIQQGSHLVQSMAAILEDLRLQPAHTLLMRLERIAHDISRRQEKHVEVLLEGGEITIDSSIIEKVADPLGHIVRNAIDHGIEKLGERLSAGKSEIAILKISAIRQSSTLIFEVSDDGRGLDESKIRDNAIKKGWISKNSQTTTEQIHAFIFEQGLSTAKELTDISGRGVGLDVVQQALVDLNGKILLETSTEGTAFRLVIPDRSTADKKAA